MRTTQSDTTHNDTTRDDSPSNDTPRKLVLARETLSHRENAMTRMHRRLRRRTTIITIAATAVLTLGTATSTVAGIGQGDSGRQAATGMVGDGGRQIASTPISQGDGG